MCTTGSASARYTPSIGSAEDHAGTDSDNDSSNENQLQRQSHDIARKQQQQQQVDLEHASGSDDDDDICQWQGAANSPPQHQQRAVLGDIGNSSRGNGPMHDSQQKHKLQQPGARVPAEVAVLTSQVTEGHIAVPTATLQALFDKVCRLIGLAPVHAALLDIEWKTERWATGTHGCCLRIVLNTT